MTGWTARARAHFQKSAPAPTDKTAETPVSSVSSVAPGGLSGKSQEGFVGFGSGTAAAFPENTIERATCWLLHFPDLEPVAVAFAPERNHAEVLAAYPDALAAEPMPEPSAVPLPGDLRALADACAKAGLYDDADIAALRSAFALDPGGVRWLIEDMHRRIQSCRRCAHFRRPGLSGGYCTGRDDLPIVYGFMHALPDDDGRACGQFSRNTT